MHLFALNISDDTQSNPSGDTQPNPCGNTQPNPCGNAQFKLNDDVDFVKFFSKKELENLIAAYENLPQTIDERVQFSWFDYGQMYGPIHNLVLKQLTTQRTP